jgi:hypothetical protein
MRYEIKPMNSSNPSGWLITPLILRTSSRADTTIINGTSRRIRRIDIFKGFIIAEIPRINRILKILLPRTLPKEILDIPIRLDWTLTANSGELVPKATTVKPTIRGDIPNKCAIREAPLTKNVAPAINPIKATINLKNI